MAAHTRAVRTRGPRCAAIAHLGQDAPTLLPLRAGDVLIVDASRAAVRAHLTSPAALAYYVDAGVRVLSSPNLHADVIATDRHQQASRAPAQNVSPQDWDAAQLMVRGPENDARAAARRHSSSCR